MGEIMTYSQIVKLLREYGAVEGDFLAAHLSMSMTDTRPYLDALEAEGVIVRRGYVVMLADDAGVSNSLGRVR